MALRFITSGVAPFLPPKNAKHPKRSLNWVKSRGFLQVPAAAPVKQIAFAYFEYEYAGPQDERPFSAHMIIDRCPWNAEHQLVRVGLQAKKLDKQNRVKANIVFLLDVSGSMNEPSKLPMVKKALSMLVNQLTVNDCVAIVVYAGTAGCVLPSKSLS